MISTRTCCNDGAKLAHLAGGPKTTIFAGSQTDGGRNPARGAMCRLRQDSLATCHARVRVDTRDRHSLMRLEGSQQPRVHVHID